MRTHPVDRAFREGLKNKSTAVPVGTWDGIQAELPKVKPPSGRPLPYWVIGSGLTMILLLSFILWPYIGSNNVSTVISRGGPDDQEVHALNSEISEPRPAESASNEFALVKSGAEEEVFAESEYLKSASASKVPVQIEVSNNAAVASATIENVPFAVPDNRSEIVALKAPADDGLATVNVNSRTDAPSLAASSENNDMLREHEAIELAELGVINAELENQVELGLIVTDCYSFDKRTTGRFFVEAFTGPSFSLRNLSSSNEDVSDYISGRDSTESSQLSWHAGLRVGFEHSSGLTARAGVQYTLVNELFYQESRTSRTIIDSIFDSSGDLIRVDTTLETGKRIKQTQNRYHAVDIPLLIGYRIDNGNWDIGIQAGPIFNILFNPKGDMLDPATGNLGSFSDTSDPDYHPVFKDKLGIGIYGSIYASKRIGENLWAFVEPHLHYRLKSITLDTYPVQQKQTNIGLSIGVRLKL